MSFLLKGSFDYSDTLSLYAAWAIAWAKNGAKIAIIIATTNPPMSILLSINITLSYCELKLLTKSGLVELRYPITIAVITPSMIPITAW